MRIWSIHPQYLDAKGLVALWRETLLAQHVLAGKTKGYKNHPQLIRFKAMPEPLVSVNYYLSVVAFEAEKRGYQFNQKKIGKFKNVKMKVTRGQMEFETTHLLKKLKTRDPEKFREISKLKTLSPHPVFKIVKGGIEEWEII
ncbi:MAG: pyrimidine dimer DNA glycosylase/endonuclease V [Bacteroidota bacterium]